MAEALSGDALGEQPLVRESGGHGQRRDSGYRRRFRLAYTALVVLLGAAGAILAVVLLRGGPGPSEAWSSWKPQASADLDRAAEIAAHVAPLYRTDGGTQLVGVQAHAPEVQNQPQNVPVEAVAVRRGISGQDIQVDSTGSSVFYILCGLGKNCAIASGSPSEERATLLRREALELALYTFKYGGADSVVAFLPPATLASGQNDVNWALYFKRSDFERELSRPLAATLPAHERLRPAALASRERATVERLTAPRAYTTNFTAAQDGGAVLVLDPLVSAQ